MRKPSARFIVGLIAAIQFVNIVDFMMVMPLGPDFAKAMNIPESKLGLIAGSYTLAAAVSGLLGATFLDKFCRRRALFFCLIGLSFGTALGALSQGFWTLLSARLVAGFFGGPATAVSLAIISDIIPPERRGQAMGAVMMSVSFAQILGVPLSLELAQVATWRAPFVAVALLGLVAASASLRWLPSMTGHICEGLSVPLGFWKRPMVQISYLMTALAMMGGFILIPNIAAFVQGNLGLPREDLKWMYLVGGLFSLATNRVAGRAVDTFGSFRVGLVGNVLLATIIFFFFAHPMGWPVVVGFSGFMVAMGLRNVSYNTLTSKVPRSDERARFQSLQSCIQHAASAFGAFISAHLLTVREVALPSGVISRQLQGMPRVATVSIAMACVMPLLMFVVERAVRKAARHEPVPSAL